MTDPNLTAIAVVLDKSGSMEHLIGDTIGSFNHFLAEQRKLPGRVLFSLTLFNDGCAIMHNLVPIEEVKPLDRTTYTTFGGTALLDAVGRTVDKLGAALAAMRAYERPSKVVVMVLTDGHENASREYTFDAVKAKVMHQRERYQWEFIFLGADVTAIEVASSIGVAPRAAMAYTASAQGMHKALFAVNDVVTSYRGGASGGSVSFSAEQRTENAPPV